jgi:hypothetical protein
MKICKKCKIEKNDSEFTKNIKSKDGLQYKCKECVKDYNSDYYSNNENYFKEKRNEWNNKNREYRNKKAIAEYHKNKDFYSLKAKVYREVNREKLNENKKEWDKNRNIDVKRKYRNEYSKRKKNDVIYKLKSSIRSYLSSCLKNKGYKKDKKTVSILGCSFMEFKLYLESKFENWMNWDNKGLFNGELNFGWDIDHIIPMSSAKTEDDVIKLNHYTNLQPLCSYTNRYIKKDSH